jgi:hypothetical protein
MGPQDPETTKLDAIALHLISLRSEVSSGPVGFLGTPDHVTVLSSMDCTVVADHGAVTGVLSFWFAPILVLLVSFSSAISSAIFGSVLFLLLLSFGGRRRRRYAPAGEPAGE